MMSPNRLNLSGIRKCADNPNHLPNPNPNLHPNPNVVGPVQIPVIVDPNNNNNLQEDDDNNNPWGLNFLFGVGRPSWSRIRNNCLLVDNLELRRHRLEADLQNHPEEADQIEWEIHELEHQVEYLRDRTITLMETMSLGGVIKMTSLVDVVGVVDLIRWLPGVAVDHGWVQNRVYRFSMGNSALYGNEVFMRVMLGAHDIDPPQVGQHIIVTADVQGNVGHITQ